MGQRLVANGDYDAGDIMGSDNRPSGQFQHRHELKKLPRERTVVAKSHKRLSVLRVQTSFTVSKPRTVKEHNDLVGDESHPTLVFPNVQWECFLLHLYSFCFLRKPSWGHCHCH